MRSKPKQSNRRASIQSIEKEFHEAIDRLVNTRPRAQKLKRMVKEGRLKISPTTVALEAGRSRTLIAMENCRLPSVRSRIREVSRKGNGQRSARDVSRSLRKEVIDLKLQLSRALEAQAEHFLAREKAEREAAKWRNALKSIEANQRLGEKVTNIFSKKPQDR